MVSVILACSEEVKAKALSAGFREQTVLVKHNACLSTEENKANLEHQLFEMQPYQFLVSDFWGMGYDG